jgi:hypothetical protein
MEKKNTDGNPKLRRIRWIARIWGTVILVVVIFILIGSITEGITGQSDPYAVEDIPTIEKIPPAFIALSALGLGLAWRWEGIGGAIAVFFQLAALPLLIVHWPIMENFPNYLIAPYGVSLLTAIPGILFLIYWWRSRKDSSLTPNT